MARVKYNLPEELVIEILYWLPVVSLLRLRSVCKSWLAIISDPKFIKAHCHHSIITSHKKASVLMLAYCDEFRDLCQSSPDFDYYLLDPHHYIVIGSCNGIICLADDNVFHLWNPATKQGKTLPILPKIEEYMTRAKPSVRLAFGLDTISDDYKILKFICPINITTKLAPVVQLYSTNTGSWKKIYVHEKSVLVVLRYQYLQLGPVIKGALYMCHKDKLVSFNLHTEMFSVVKCPNSVFRYSDVLDFDGSVAVISGSLNLGSGISLWTLDDIPGQVSWTKKFNVRDDISWVYSYLGGGLLYGSVPWGKMYTSSHSSAEILYAYIRKKFKLPVKTPIRSVLNYRETFNSVKGFHPMHKIMVDWFKPRVEQV